MTETLTKVDKLTTFVSVTAGDSVQFTELSQSPVKLQPDVGKLAALPLSSNTVSPSCIVPIVSLIVVAQLLLITHPTQQEV